MDKLNWALRQICNRNKDGAFGTQAARGRSLDLMARELRALGFHNLRAGRGDRGGCSHSTMSDPFRASCLSGQQASGIAGILHSFPSRDCWPSRSLGWPLARFPS